jgi:hypothetical protein
MGPIIATETAYKIHYSPISAVDDHEETVVEPNSNHLENND